MEVDGAEATTAVSSVVTLVADMTVELGGLSVED